MPSIPASAPEPTRGEIIAAAKEAGLSMIAFPPVEDIPRPAPRLRLRHCVEAWPECETGMYNPSCCRFPKSCSCDIYDDDQVTSDDLEPGRASSEETDT